MKKLLINNNKLIRSTALDDEEIVIPDGVTEICDRAFYNHSRLKKITIPASVTVMGEFVFWGCFELETIIVPDNFDLLDGYDLMETKFYNKNDKKFLTLGSTLIKYTPDKYNDPDFPVVVPDGITRIGWEALTDLTEEHCVSCPSTVTQIEPEAFSDRLLFRPSVIYRGE